MRLSYFFEDLRKAYQAEIADLQSDSEGKNVLAARLKEKRAQFSQLMPMIDSAPEMVAVAFHGGLTFSNPHAMALLASTEPEDFPAWEELAQAVHFDTASQKLADTALLESGGERFVITSVCLEYLYGKSAMTSEQARAHDSDGDDHERNEDNEGNDDKPEPIDGEEQDLEEAGADWLAEQGFDRRG